MRIVKIISKISIATILFILIISKPVISDSATRIKYSIDTGVVIYEEKQFLYENYPKYYIDYIDNQPYILTNIKYINKWDIKRIEKYDNVEYTIVDNNTIYINNINNGMIAIFMDILPNENYILTFNSNVEEDITLHTNRIHISVRSNERVIYSFSVKLRPYNEIYLETTSDVNNLRFILRNDYQDNNIEISNIILRKADDEIINRPAKTYIKEHAPYDYIGHKVIGGFMDLVKKIDKPKEFIAELTGEVKDFIVKLIFF